MLQEARIYYTQDKYAVDGLKNTLTRISIMPVFKFSCNLYLSSATSNRAMSFTAQVNTTRRTRNKGHSVSNQYNHQRNLESELFEKIEC